MSDNINLPANIILELQTRGFENAEQIMKAILREQKALGNSNGDLIKKYGDLKKATDALIKSYKERGKTATDELGKEEKAVLKLKKIYYSLGEGVDEVADGLKKMILPSSFGNAITLTDKYNKSLIQSSASVNRLGIGLKGLETSLTRIGAITSLTREETLKLFDQFQSGMREISISDFESTMKRMRNIVGSNADAMGQMQDALSAISQEYPSLSRGLLDIAKADSINNAAQQESLQNRVRNLYFIGKISDAQYRQVSAYLRGNKQISSADSDRQKEIKEQIKATQELKRQMEIIGLAVGQAILPGLVMVSGILKNITKGAETAAGSMKNVGRVLVGMMFAKAAFSIGKMAVGGIGGLLSKGGRGGGGGGVGGALAGIVGGATPVRVVNFNEMGGIGSILGPKTLTPAQKHVADWETNYAKKSSKLGLGGRIKRAGPALGVGAMLAGGSYLANQASTVAEAAGYKKTGIGLGLGGAAMGVASGAVTGAAIGSILPVVGTAIGGLIGGALGVFSQWGNITENIGKLLGKEGKSKESGKFRKDFEKEQEEEKNKRNEERALQAQIDEGNKTNMGEISKLGIAGVFTKAKERAKTANEALALKRETVDETIRAKLGMTFKEGEGAPDKQQQIRDKIEGQEEELRKAKETYASKQLDMSQPERIGAQDFIREKEEELKKTKEIVEEVEKEAPGYQAALKEAENLNAQMETMSTLAAKQRDAVAAMNGLYEAQSSLLDTIVGNMSLTGQVDYSEASAQLEKTLSYLEASVTEQEALINILKSNQGLSIDEVLKKKDLNKQQVILLKGMEKAGVTSIDQAVTDAELLKLDEKRAKAVQEESKARLNMIHLMDGQLKYAKASATQASLMVQLADNFAIGVGASADMRIKAFQAEEDIIAGLKEQLKLNRIEQSTAPEKQRLALITQEKDLQNEILQSQIKQAGQVKSLRDGWVSAISAMNTGFGSFSEIVMDSSQNLAQLAKTPGAVTAPILGTMSKKGSWGHSNSESIVTHGGIGQIYSKRYGQSPKGRWEQSIRSDLDRRFGGDIRNLERGMGENVGENIARQASRNVQGGASALGAGNAMALAAHQASQANNTQYGTGGVARKDLRFNNPVQNSQEGENQPPPSDKESTANILLPSVNISVNIQDVSELTNKVIEALQSNIHNGINDAFRGYGK